MECAVFSAHPAPAAWRPTSAGQNLSSAGERRPRERFPGEYARTRAACPIEGGCSL